MYGYASATSVSRNGCDGSVLESWKEIATFFGREVRTVQLWEKHESMPVHRHLHRKQGRIYAYRKELEAWKAAATVAPSHGETPVVAADAEVLPEVEVASRRLGLLPIRLLQGMGGGEPGNAAMERALQDELVVELCRLDLETVVLSGVCEQSSEGRRERLAEAMRTLQLCGLLTGTVRREGRRTRISMQLLAGEELRCVWSERFDSVCQSSLDAQMELACAVGCALPLEKLGISRSSVTLPTGGLSAEEAYALGRFFWEQRNEPALRRAETYLRRAIALDPTFTPSYAALADCYVSYAHSHAMPSAAAAETANRALRPVLASGQGAIGRSPAALNGIANVMLSCNRDWKAGVEHCAMACEQNPNDSRALQLYAMYMMAHGRHEESIRYATEALQIHPMSKVLNNELGYAFYFAGDFDRAVPFVERSISLDKEFVMGHSLLGKLEVQRGNWDAAMASLETAVTLSGGASFHLATMAYAYGAMGDRRRGRELLRSAETDAVGKCRPWATLAAAHLSMGEEDAAFAALGRARQESDAECMVLRSDPRFLPMHGQPEFDEMVDSLQLQ